MKKVLAITALLATLLATLSGCMSYYNIPSGHIGKVLTPSGFDQAVLQPGQVNIGVGGAGGRNTKIVLLEATTITMPEYFRDAATSTDSHDHRILTKDGVPASVDVSIRVALPDNPQTINDIFNEVTAVQVKDNDRVSEITLKNIYDRFVQMDVRNIIRNVISQYANFQEVYAHYQEANNQIHDQVIASFKKNNVPLLLQDAQLSQVLPDPQVWDSEVKKKSAEGVGSQMDIIGEHAANNPGYLEYLKWQTLLEAFKNGNNTIVITDGTLPGSFGIVVDPKSMKKEPLPTTPSVKK